MTEDDLFNITIRIAGKNLGGSIQIKRGEEALYRRSADYVDNKLSKFIKRHPKQSMETYLSLVAFEIAVELLEEKNDKSSVFDRIEALEKEVDEDLKK